MLLKCNCTYASVSEIGGGWGRRVSYFLLAYCLLGSADMVQMSRIWEPREGGGIAGSPSSVALLRVQGIFVPKAFSSLLFIGVVAAVDKA